MRSVVLENTDVRVSRLSFGTASLHHLVTARQRQRMLAAAADAGITHFDTSPYYGDGLAETDLGAFARSRRSDLTIATKVGLYPRLGEARRGWQVWLRKVHGKLKPGGSSPVIDWSVERARASLRDSLRRLHCDYVDFLFLHEPKRSLIDDESMWRWLESERATGTIRNWGVAGLAAVVEPWVTAASPLAAVVQTRDDREHRAADFLLTRGRRLQFTYGYLSSARKPAGSAEADALMRAALERNTDGSVLFSSRRPEHVQAWASHVS